MASSPRARKKLSQHELARFLFYLARTGNFAFACDRLGRAQSGLYKRRARDPDFAADCKAALDQARSSLWRTEGGPRKPGADAKSGTILSTHAGRPQLRRAAPGTLTKAGRQRFLETLAATANIRFAAHSVGVAPSSIHHRRRTDPAFARDMDAAIDTAVAALELRVIEASGVLEEDSVHPEPVGPQATEGQRSDRTSAPRIATLTTAEALHFLTLHARAPKPKRAIARQSKAYVEESARAGRPAHSDRIDVTSDSFRVTDSYPPRDESSSSKASDDAPAPATEERERPSPRVRRL